jgi:hypothetical protein
MAKKRSKKNAADEALARLKKEMAAPRMANSVREQEAKLNARAARLGTD